MLLARDHTLRATTHGKPGLGRVLLLTRQLGGLEKQSHKAVLSGTSKSQRAVLRGLSKPKLGHGDSKGEWMFMRQEKTQMLF